MYIIYKTIRIHIRILLSKISLEFFGPKEIRFYPVGYLCNYTCPMCWRSKLDRKSKLFFTKLEKKSLSIQEYKQLFNFIPPATQNIEIVGGGEPLFYKEILQLTKLIKKNHYHGSLITNGTLLNKQISKELISQKWDKIRISIHASNSTTFFKITKSNSFHLIEKNLKKLIKLRNSVNNKSTTIIILFVIQKENINDIYNFYTWGKSLGVDFIEYDILHSTSKESRLNHKELEIAIKQLNKLKNKNNNNANNIINRYKNNPNSSIQINEGGDYFKNKKCIIPSESMIIDSIGNVELCCFLSSSNYRISNIRSDYNIYSLWKNKFYRKIRKDFREGKFKKICTNSCIYQLPNK